MLFVTMANAQDKIGLAILQDAKLMTIGDKETGLNAGTLDILIRSTWQGYQQEFGYMQMIPEFEYANLSDGNYKRYSVSGGYVFNKLVVDNLELGLNANIGLIDRWTRAYATYGVSIELNYKLSDKVKVVTSSQLIKRGDLKERYNTTKLKPSFYVGIEISLN